MMDEQVRYTVYELHTNQRALSVSYCSQEEAEQAATYLSSQEPGKAFYVSPVFK